MLRFATGILVHAQQRHAKVFVIYWWRVHHVPHIQCNEAREEVHRGMLSGAGCLMRQNRSRVMSLLRFFFVFACLSFGRSTPSA